MSNKSTTRDHQCKKIINGQHSNLKFKIKIIILKNKMKDSIDKLNYRETKFMNWDKIGEPNLQLNLYCLSQDQRSFINIIFS